MSAVGGRLVLVGAYPAMPASARQAAAANTAFLQSVLDSTGCGGLEVPWASSAFVPDTAALLRFLARGGQHQFTLIAATMERQAPAGRAGAGFGLASLDDGARLGAVGLVRGACLAVAGLAGATGAPAVGDIVVHSAPRCNPERLQAHQTALERSLAEIASWDWSGARLAVEHCDSVTGPRPMKGFLPLESEIRAVSAVARSRTPVGVAINWGRSTLDAGRLGGADSHALRAAEARLLTGLGVSGISAAPTPLGGGWTDNHVPVSGAAAADAGFGSSLLTSRRLAGFLGLAPKDATVTVKVAAPPAGNDPASDPLALITESYFSTISALSPKESCP